MGYIYLITNTVTKKSYVGQTLHEDVETRWNQHKRMYGNMIGRCIYNAYKKYGIENFQFKIICICFDEACNELEEHYIQKYNTISPLGYNLKSGGNNSKHNPETKALISKNRKGKGLNVVYTTEMRRERSVRIVGERNPNFGKTPSDDVRKRISERMKEIWKEKKRNGIGAHENTVKALRDGLERKRATKIPKQRVQTKGRKQRVAKLDEDGNVIEEFESIAEACSKTGLLNCNISQVCRGEKKTTGGFGWKYLDVEHGTKVIRNISTGELYINKCGTGFLVRISKKSFAIRKWYKTIEEAIVERDKCVIEMNAQ